MTALSGELQRLSNERQGIWSLFASLAGVAIVASGGFLAISTSDSQISKDVSPWIWAGISVVPAIVTTYGLTLLIQIGIQSYYGRELERQLTEILREEDRIPPSSMESVGTALVGHRRGLWQIRIIYLLLYALLAAVVTTSSVLAAWRIDVMSLRVPVMVALGLLFVVTTDLAYQAVVHGSEIWTRVRTQVLRELDETFPHHDTPRTQRRLISYLAFPRPNDLLVKGILLHLGSALVGAWLARDSTSWTDALRTAGVSFLGFEFLMYQARYMLNDERGIEDDVVNPEAWQRKRLPPDLDTPTRENSVRVVIIGRIAGALVLALLLVPPDSRTIFIACLAAIWGLAVAYERFRAAPVVSPELSFNSWSFKVYAIVGISYAIRAGLGLYLGSSTMASGWLLATIIITFYFSGMATVLMAWALEATLYAGHLRPAASSVLPYIGAGSIGDGQANAIGRQIGSKQHVLPLARAAGFLSSDAVLLDESIDAEGLVFRNARVLVSASRWSQPWNVIFVVACAFAGLAGWLGSELHAVGGPYIATAAAGIVGLVAVRRPHEAAGLALASVVAQSVGLGWLGGSYDAMFVQLPLVTVVLTYATTRDMNYLDSISLLTKLARLPRRLGSGVLTMSRELLR